MKKAEIVLITVPFKGRVRLVIPATRALSTVKNNIPFKGVQPTHKPKLAPENPISDIVCVKKDRCRAVMKTPMIPHKIEITVATIRALRINSYCSIIIPPYLTVKFLYHTSLLIGDHEK